MPLTIARPVYCAAVGRVCPVLLAWLLPAVASAQTFSVSPCTDSGAQHERYAMKTRKAPATRNAANIPEVSVRDMVRWATPKNPTVSGSPLNARERQIVMVTGWVRLTKISDDDCDIHIQLAADPSKHFPQVIAEIPPASKTLRKEFAHALGANVTKSTKFFDGPRAVKITVTGFAFFDASHVCADHPKEGCAHGRGVSTLWELHPVLALRRAP
jgi:hypothetical protein